MSVVTWLETDRLLLRPSRISDARALLAILGDEASRPHTFNLASLREARRYIAANECHRRKLGYGLWIVTEKSSGQIVGFGGLYDDPFDVLWGPEIAYHFTTDVRGEGYATELTLYALNTAREMNLAEVSAFAHPDNAASRRVLEKAGFIQERFIAGMNRHLYVRQLSA
ncbi:MAG: GNAT family N-acetyltransferase [Parvibaculum sp.]|uniref:GNAT family N-acetyltransferase n=1 Tax=Parvibaculum sp. TaxID=2024848 RepID=UPI0032ED9418